MEHFKKLYSGKFVKGYNHCDPCAGWFKPTRVHSDTSH